MSKEAKTDAWMPLYIGDWDGDTGHLSCEEDGAYGRLVRWYWRRGPLPDEDAALARIIRMDLKAWKRIRPTIAAFFAVGHGVWRHNRVDLELVRWADKKLAAQEKARIAAEKRWGPKDPEKPRPKPARRNAPSITQAKREQCPSTSPTEVDAPPGQSTLCAAETPEARHDGASGLRLVEPDNSSRGWLYDADRADRELILAKRQDPDHASELAEFIAYAKEEANRLRRMAA